MTIIFERMNAFKKPYRNAVLKNLPEEKQRAIMEYADGTETSKPHTLAETLKWLKADAITTSHATLEDFRQWFRLRQDMQEDEAMALQTVQACKENGWIKTRQEEEAAGQIFFNRQTQRRKDTKAWVLVQGVSLRRDRLDLEERKFKLLQDRQARTKEVVNNTQMTPEQKEARIRQIMGLT